MCHYRQAGVGVYRSYMKALSGISRSLVADIKLSLNPLGSLTHLTHPLIFFLSLRLLDFKRVVAFHVNISIKWMWQKYVNIICGEWYKRSEEEIRSFHVFPNEFINNIAHVPTHLWRRCSAGATNGGVTRDVLSTKSYPPLEGAAAKENTQEILWNLLFFIFLSLCVSQ